MAEAKALWEALELSIVQRFGGSLCQTTALIWGKLVGIWVLSASLNQAAFRRRRRRPS